MKNYIISLAIVGIIGAIANSLVDKNTTTGKLVQLLSGVLVTVTLISPLVNISFSNIVDYFDALSVQANAHTDIGQKAATQSIASIIKAQTEAYILDKADRMNVDIVVEVVLDDNHNSIPCAVTIEGNISPYTREVLSTYIADNLGIEKENQRWI